MDNWLCCTNRVRKEGGLWSLCLANHDCFGHTEPRHGIQGGEAGIGFGSLGVEAVISQLPTEEGFEAKHSRFSQTAAMVAMMDFPRLGVVVLDIFQDGRARMRPASGQRRPRHRPGAGQNQGGCPAVEQGLMAGMGIIG